MQTEEHNKKEPIHHNEDRETRAGEINRYQETPIATNANKKNPKHAPKRRFKHTTHNNN